MEVKDAKARLQEHVRSRDSLLNMMRPLNKEEIALLIFHEQQIMKIKIGLERGTIK